MSDITKRLFFGLALDEHSKTHIYNWLTRDVKTYRPLINKNNLHLTLAFLGNVNANDEKRYISYAEQIKAKSFALSFGDTGYWQQTGIFYLRPSGIPKQLDMLASSLRNKSHKLATYHNPFAFNPHITLVRGAKRQEPTVYNKMAPLNYKFKQFTLFHSTRIDNQLTYVPIQHFSLL